MLVRMLPAGALALAANIGPAHAEEVSRVELEPSSQWLLDYSETRCRIARAFGEGDDRAALYLEQYEPSDEISWLVAGSLVEGLRSRRKFTVQFGPGLAPYEIESDVILSLGDLGASVRGQDVAEPEEDEPHESIDDSSKWSVENPVGLPALSPERGRSIDWIEFSRRDRRYRLNTGNLGSVFEAMNTCMDDLVVHWGGDPEVLRTRATPPRPTNLRRVVTHVQRHYPERAVRRGENADLNIRVMVDEKGKVVSCHITDMTLAENFDDFACDVFNDIAKFEPARDTSGKAIASYYVTRVIYRMSL